MEGRGTNQKITCKDGKDCLKAWKDLEAKQVADQHCYQSRWSGYPCLFGLRYGCEEAWASTNKGLTRYDLFFIVS